MENGRNLLGTHHHYFARRQASLKKRIVEELSTSIDFDKLATKAILFLASANFPWKIIEILQPARRINAVPFLAAKWLKKTDHVRYDRRIEVLRLCEINTARAYVKSEF